MMRILSWSSGLGCDKVQYPDHDVFVPNQQVTSIVNSSLPVSVKRKRSLSSNETSAELFGNLVPDKEASHETLTGMNDTTKFASSRREFVTSACLPSPPDTNVSDNQSITTSPTMDAHTDTQLQMMRETISSQLSLEILLKHKELRLIDQEVAKCQIALEQLRRCSEIPYPSTQQPSVLLTEGRGSAVRRLSERYPAESPAPWGVTDGPYTRHYSKWLLPDHRFDGGEPEISQPLASGNIPTAGRSTRGHVVDVGNRLSKSRSQRAELKALPAGYGQPKEKATGPMILKRKSDGVMVKLVCPDCGRLDFGSAQGFINHCRIGHGRSFASHDAAAEACGESVQYNANGTVKGIEPVTVPSNAHVHPLVRSAKLATQTPSLVYASLRGGYRPESQASSRDRQSKVMSPDFHASSHTPNLSALIKNKGLGLNLQDLVADVKSRIQQPESDDEFDEMDIDSPVPTNTGRHPQVAGSKQPVKSSMKKISSPLLSTRQHPSSSKVLSIPANSNALLMNDRRQSFAGTLPSPTNESTQAPSLVDDDEEFDAQTPMSSDDVDDVDDAEVDFEVHDDEHGDRVVNLRHGELNASQPTCAPSPRTHSRQRSVTTRALTAHGGEKRATIVSPSPAPEGSDRKRRKIEEK